MFGRKNKISVRQPTGDDFKLRSVRDHGGISPPIGTNRPEGNPPAVDGGGFSEDLNARIGKQ